MHVVRLKKCYDLLMKITFASLLLCLLGCSPTPEPIPASRVYQPPVTTAVEGGEVVVISVPVRSHGHVVEYQTCFIWRDAVNGASSIQCPNDRTGYTFDGP